MIRNEVSGELQRKDAQSEKLAVFGKDLMKKKSSTCMLPKITENNKNKDYVNVIDENKKLAPQIPSRKYSSVPADKLLNMEDQSPASNARRYSRRLSVAGANLNNRKSVDLRSSNLRLSRYDEVSPLSTANGRSSGLFNQFASDSLNEETPRQSRRSKIQRPIIEPLTESALEDGSETAPENNNNQDSKLLSKNLAKELKRLTTMKVKEETSKEESKIRRTFRLFIIFWIFGTATAIFGIIRYLLRKTDVSDVESIIVMIGQLIFVSLAIITPRGILTKIFREKVERSQRFQNLRNVFIEKEVDDFNKKLQSQGF